MDDEQEPTVEATDFETELDENDEPHGEDLGEVTEGEWVDDDEDELDDESEDER